MKSSRAFLLVVALIMCSCADDTITIAPSNSAQNPRNEKMQLNLKVYVETSAGMDGYLCDGSDLRTVIYDYIDKLSHECDSTKFYHANDKIVPFKGNIEPKNVIRVQTVYGKPKSSIVSQIPLNAFLMFNDLAK